MHSCTWSRSPLHRTLQLRLEINAVISGSSTNANQGNSSLGETFVEKSVSLLPFWLVMRFVVELQYGKDGAVGRIEENEIDVLLGKSPAVGCVPKPIRAPHDIDEPRLQRQPELGVHRETQNSIKCQLARAEQEPRSRVRTFLARVPRATLVMRSRWRLPPRRSVSPASLVDKPSPMKAG